MFNNFNGSKTAYRKAQLFPFLIAVVCIILIMALITVDLGELSVYKTDVANAADAGALAGASVISNALLELGAHNEYLFGEAVALCAAIIISMITFAWPVTLALALATLVLMYDGLSIAMGNTMMGLANAKKTAMQYAFQNAGIDMPRPTFECFLTELGIISEGEYDPTADYGEHYTYYQKADPEDWQYYFENYGINQAQYKRIIQSGFSRFIEDENGKYGFFAGAGKIEPDSEVGTTVTAAFGWDDKPEHSYSSIDNSYDQQRAPSTVAYDNVVEVTARGSNVYPLAAWSFLGAGFLDLTDCLFELIFDGDVPDWVELLMGFIEGFFNIILDIMANLLDSTAPTNLVFQSDARYPDKEMTENNQFIVQVRRRKANRSRSAGSLWRGGSVGFDEVSAESASVCYSDGNTATIMPVELIFAFYRDRYIELERGSGDFLCSMLLQSGDDWEVQDKSAHLFEVKLDEIRR